MAVIEHLDDCWSGISLILGADPCCKDDIYAYILNVYYEIISRARFGCQWYSIHELVTWSYNVPL